MAEYHADIIIHGAGIAGLWTLQALRKAGYHVLLVETDAIGAGQTLASQGIIHSGLKYLLSGHVSDVAKRISAMPERWQDEPALEKAKINAASQLMLIQKGLGGNFVKLLAGKALGSSAGETNIPAEIKQAGFEGSAIELKEPVYDVASVLQALAEPYKDYICKSADGLRAQIHIYTAGAGNTHKDLQIQKRPLLMGLVKNAPFPLYAHFLGLSDKPAATITTHKTKGGALVWYLGGQVAERSKDGNPQDLFRDIKNLFAKYLPGLETQNFEWASYPIDRVEGKTKTGALPDLPVIQEMEGNLYCWPTKLAFAPLLVDMILQKLEEKNIRPGGDAETPPASLPVEYARAPWDKVTWTKGV